MTPLAEIVVTQYAPCCNPKLVLVDAASSVVSLAWASAKVVLT